MWGFSIANAIFIFLDLSGKMKWLYVVVAILVTVSAEDNFCSTDINGNCNGVSGK